MLAQGGEGQPMGTVVWDGLVGDDVLHEDAAKVRNQLTDAAKNFEWGRLTAMLREQRDLVNITRSGGTSLFAPLHQAAYGGAPMPVVEELLELGAWRTLQNARGERPIDVAERRGHHHLLDVLEPRLLRHVPIGVLLKVQAHFHTVIQGRAPEQTRGRSLRLPELEPLLELEPGIVWFAVPGMYGGFAYDLRSNGVEAMLEAESWCRVVGGSGQRHEITSAGSRLVEEGFV